MRNVVNPDGERCGNRALVNGDCPRCPMGAGRSVQKGAWPGALFLLARYSVCEREREKQRYRDTNRELKRETGNKEGGGCDYLLTPVSFCVFL